MRPTATTRLSRRLVELLCKNVEGLDGMIAHGDERFRRDDECDAGNVRRILRFAGHAGMQVAHAVLRIMRLGGLGIVRIGLRGDRRADELLHHAILLDRRRDEVDPDGARRKRLSGLKLPACDRCSRVFGVL
jgi:hypothetical protein